MGPSATVSAALSCSTAAAPGWTATSPPGASCAWLTLRAYGSPGRIPMLRRTFVTTMLDAGVDLRDVQIAARHADPRTTNALRLSPQVRRPPPELHPRAYMASGT